MSKTPVVISGDVNVKVASHLSNVPFISTDASTSNVIVLCTGVIAKTGASLASCLRPTGKNKMDTKRQWMATGVVAAWDTPFVLLTNKAENPLFPNAAFHNTESI